MARRVWAIFTLLLCACSTAAPPPSVGADGTTELDANIFVDAAADFGPPTDSEDIADAWPLIPDFSDAAGPNDANEGPVDTGAADALAVDLNADGAQVSDITEILQDVAAPDAAADGIATPDGAPDATPDATADGPADTVLPAACTPGGCDDANTCTTDSCIILSGCVHLPNKITCDDAEACTTADTCNGGKCAGLNKLFDKAYGGAISGLAKSLAVLADGFAIAGYTTTPSATGSDFWLIRLDAGGTQLWEKTYGGAKDDLGFAIAALADGFLLAGSTTSFGAGSNDVWLVRADGAGKQLWHKAFGGGGDDRATCVAALVDGSAVGGANGSKGAGSSDFWLLRTDADGNLLWDKTYGGKGYDEANAIAVLPDGFALAGVTASFGAGSDDFWLVRTDGTGNKLWAQTYGGPDGDTAYALATLDNGFAIAGYKGGDKSNDFWLVRTDTAGVQVADYAYGGDGDERAFAVAVFKDGFALAGYTNSKGAGSNDGWVVRTDNAGKVIADKTYGGANFDAARALAALPDGVVFAGSTALKGSNNVAAWLVRTDAFGSASCADSGNCAAKTLADCDDSNDCTDDFCAKDKACSHIANSAACSDDNSCTTGDACLLGTCTGKAVDTKTVCDDNVPCTVDSCDAESGCVHYGTYFDATYGGAASDVATAIAALADGLVLAGYTASKGAGKNDFWLVRSDALGRVIWQRTYGGGGSDSAYAVVALADGFAVVGDTASKGNGGPDFWLVRTDAGGNPLWDKTVGGTASESAKAVAVFKDGFVMAGSTNADALGKGDDFFLVRVDEFGALVWEKSYGGAFNDQAFAVAALPDGMAVAGLTQSKGAGGSDFWLVRTDPAGNLLWDKTYGGKSGDQANALVALADGFALAGSTATKGLGFNDFWLVRTDLDGKLLWDKTYGTSSDDVANGLSKVAGGLVLAGYTESKGPGPHELFVVKIDVLGNEVWQKVIGGAGNNYALAVAAFKDGLAMTGYTTGKGAGNADFWLVRTDAWGHASCAEAGVCFGKSVLDCDDGGACTKDVCDAVLGCQSGVFNCK